MQLWVAIVVYNRLRSAQPSSWKNPYTLDFELCFQHPHMLSDALEVSMAGFLSKITSSTGVIVS